MCPVWGSQPGHRYSPMVQYIQLAFAALALASLVAGEALDWGLSDMLKMLLAGLVGVAVPRPSDMLAPKE